jgi:hypothetical protein
MWPPQPYEAVAISPTFLNQEKIHWWGDDLGTSIRKAFLLQDVNGVSIFQGGNI